jgi:hypothetical protein
LKIINHLALVIWLTGAPSVVTRLAQPYLQIIEPHFLSSATCVVHTFDGSRRTRGRQAVLVRA